LAAQMPTEAIDFDALFRMEKGFKRYYPELNLECFNQFPKLFNEQTINKYYHNTQTENEFLLIPGLAAGILQKSKATRGVEEVF
ncbi:MAG: hypothetical protein AAF705_05035, partial [Bacteroidota bacterium]